MIVHTVPCEVTFVLAFTMSRPYCYDLCLTRALDAGHVTCLMYTFPTCPLLSGLALPLFAFLPAYRLPFCLPDPAQCMSA